MTRCTRSPAGSRARCTAQVAPGFYSSTGVAAAGIKTVVIGSTQPCVWVLDDLGFDTEPELAPVENSAWGTIKALHR